MRTYHSVKTCAHRSGQPPPTPLGETVFVIHAPEPYLWCRHLGIADSMSRPECRACQRRCRRREMRVRRVVTRREGRTEMKGPILRPELRMCCLLWVVQVILVPDSWLQARQGGSRQRRWHRTMFQGGPEKFRRRKRKGAPWRLRARREMQT